MLNFDWKKGFCLEECNAAPGSPGVTCRYLSQMKNMYADKTTCENILISLNYSRRYKVLAYQPL